MISDTLELLRPKIKLCNSLEEATRQVQDLEREFLIKLGKKKYKGKEVFLTIPVFLKILSCMVMISNYCYSHCIIFLNLMIEIFF